MGRAMEAAQSLAGRIVVAGGGRVRAVILHGSLAAGGFQAGRSDIDLLVVVDGALGEAEAAELEALVRAAELGGAAGVDLQVVTAAAAAAGAPAVELQVFRHGGEAVEVSGRAEEFDVLAELSMARAHGRALAGAAPRAVIGAVPAGAVVERGRFWLRRWRSLTDDREHAVFMVLTACRMWRFAEEGTHCSKAEAGAWALARDPSLDVVRQALRRHGGDLTAEVDPAGLGVLLDRVLDR